MSYFIFFKNFENIEGGLYKIAENQNDLNNLNITKNDYKIIEDSQENFELVKLNKKSPNKYINDSVVYTVNDEDENFFRNKETLKNYIFYFKNSIKQFLDNNTNHPSFNVWKNYYDQLNNLNIDIVPLNKSLQEYFKDLGQPYLNPLQIP